MSLRPPLLGWMILLVGYAAGCAGSMLLYGLGRYGERQEVHALRRGVDSLSTRCRKVYFPDTTRTP
jgi:membrane protein DedA with SNARE-associated domain